VYREREGSTTLPGDADRRGDPSGETGVLEMVQRPGNSSPEFYQRTTRSSCRRECHPGVQEKVKLCQRGVLGRGRMVGTEGDRGKHRSSPELDFLLAALRAWSRAAWQRVC
jgi:hypothetical protein